VLFAVRCRLHAAGSRLPGPRYGLGLLFSDLLRSACRCASSSCKALAIAAACCGDQESQAYPSRPAGVPPGSRERLTQIDTQLPKLLRRHRLLHDAVLIVYAGVAVLVLSVITIGIAVTASPGAAGTAALVLVLAGTVMLLRGLLSAARSIIISTDAIDYEVKRTVSLGS